MAQHSNSEPQPNWPDLAVDQTAWEMAKLQVRSNATISEIAQRAQANKLTLQTEGEDELEQLRRQQ
jgi:hypothetical protein